MLRKILLLRGSGKIRLIPREGGIEDGRMTDKEDKMEIEVDNKDSKIDSNKEIDLTQILRDNLTTLFRAVELDDKNLISRIWTKNTVLRKDLPLSAFQDVLVENIPKGALLNRLLAFVDLAAKEEEKALKGKQPKLTNSQTKAPKDEPLMEVESYLTLLIISSLVKFNLYTEALDCCRELISRFKLVNRITLDSFVAKTYHYYALASERLHHSSPKTMNDPFSHYNAFLLQELLQGQKTSALRLYDQAQATIINLILRKYIAEKLYSQAKMFLNNLTKFPILESSNVGNNQQIRYLYYSAKVASVKANYSSSNESVTRAIRKCPTNTGLGFRLSLHKLSVVVKLLMGELPDRSVFHEPEFRKELEPYFCLVKSVGNGSVAEYDKISKKFEPMFERDDLVSLVKRLRSSVIKTGLRNINIAYSQIEFKDVMQKLELKSEKDAELVCAKAIRDSIIQNAVIESESKTLLSTKTVDVYSTTLQPKEQFSSRTKFCLGVYNAAMKAHKYPPNSHKPVEEKTQEKVKTAGKKKDK